MIKARKFIVLKHFKGKPQKSDLQLIEEELPSLQNGGKNLLYNIYHCFILYIYNIFNIYIYGDIYEIVK